MPQKTGTYSFLPLLWTFEPKALLTALPAKAPVTEGSYSFLMTSMTRVFSTVAFSLRRNRPFKNSYK